MSDLNKSNLNREPVNKNNPDQGIYRTTEFVSLCIHVYNDEFYSQHLNEACDSIISDLLWIYCNKNENEIVKFEKNEFEYLVVLLIGKERMQEQLKAIEDFSGRIYNTLSVNLHLTIKLGLSTAKDSIDEALRESKIAAKYGIYNPDGYLVWYEETKQFKAIYKISPEQEEIIRINLKTRDFVSIEKVLSEIFETITASKPCIKSIELLIMRLALILQEEVYQDNESKDNLRELIDSTEIYNKFNSVRCLKNYITEMYKTAINVIGNINEPGKNRYIEAAILYMQNNLKKQITLNKVAKMLFLNPCYLSVLFKEVTGSNFHEYLSAMRLDKAKKLLSDENEKIYEIAEKVGYGNQRYFSQDFKKRVGCTPTEFKNKTKVTEIDQPPENGKIFESHMDISNADVM